MIFVCSGRRIGARLRQFYCHLKPGILSALYIDKAREQHDCLSGQTGVESEIRGELPPRLAADRFGFCHKQSFEMHGHWEWIVFLSVLAPCAVE